LTQFLGEFVIFFHPCDTIRVEQVNNEQRTMNNVKMAFLPLLFFLFSLFFCANAFAQVASRTDGNTVFYYDSLFEAFEAATGTSIDQPDEITLLADLVLDEPLTLADGRHIRLVAGGSGLQGGHRTIRRSADLIEFPVVWVRGDTSSLTLGKPGMEYELIVDGGRLNSPPIEAHCPLVAVSGPDSKLVMYDKVTLQNNINNGTPWGTSYYENGSGVFIRTQGDITDRQAEFIMKGGTIRGNVNDLQTLLACGGGVYIAGVAVFTMEGGVIMNNTARFTGGGFHTGSRGSFNKTGGVIYGSNAPAGYRNTALNGYSTPKIYGHSVCVAIVNPLSQFRNDTVGENDKLSYTGVLRGNGIFGEGDKWDNPDKVFRRMLIAVILPVLALAVSLFFILRKRAYKKLMKRAQEAVETPVTVFEGVNLSPREKEVGKLLLTELSIKQIATVMKIAYVTVDFHSKKLYRKMGIQGRMELLLKNNEQRTKIKKGNNNEE
jgi:DNA-binding CsgD family transcriptional regulator